MPFLPQSAHFQRVKKDHQHEVVEDYVEEIARMHDKLGEARSSDLTRRFGVSAAAVSKIITRLKREGLVEARPYRGIFLTDAGQKMAQKIIRRHDIVVRTLIALGVPYNLARSDAEGIEHHCSDQTVEAMRRFLEQHEDPR